MWLHADIQTVTLILLTIIHHTYSKQCDHELWDDPMEGRGVKHLNTDCTTGQIRWHAPYGGISLKLNSPDRPSRLCLQMYAVHTPAVVFLRKESSLEKMVQLISSSSHETASKVTRCFPFPKNSMQDYYLESGVGAPVSSEVIVDYDIETDWRNDECMPCTDEELLWHYCASDFVGVGHMTDLKNTATTSIISVSLDLLKQQSLKHFTVDKKKYRGLIHAPSKCNMNFGNAKFVFMGRLQFGEAHLRCAPTYDDFLEVQKTAVNKLSCR